MSIDGIYDLYLDRLSKYKREPIPLLVHQIWLYSDLNKPIPKKELELHENLKQDLSSKYEYKFWDNTNIESLWELPELQKYKEYFQKVQPHIVKCDMVRYAILYAMGGVYLDMDSVLEDKELIANRNKDHIYYKEVLVIDDVKPGIFNGYLVSRKHNPFWLLVLDLICQKISTYPNYTIYTIQDVYSTSGPKLLSEIVLTLNARNRQVSIDSTSEEILSLEYSDLPISINQSILNGWKSELMKVEAKNTCTIWVYFLVLVLPILFILVYIMWCWNRNSLQKKTLKTLQNIHPKNTSTFWVY